MEIKIPEGCPSGDVLYIEPMVYLAEGYVLYRHLEVATRSTSIFRYIERIERIRLLATEI
jgi:hypothetical protein